MFKIEKNIIAVSIGEKVLYVAHLQGVALSQKVVGLGKEGFEGGDASMWGDKISTIVQGFGVKKPATFCVIPSNIVTTKNIEIPSLDEEEIRSIIDLQAGRHTPYSREEILIGYISIGVFQRNYTKVLLIIANREVVKARLEACELAGLHVDKVLFGPECVATFYASILNIESEDDPIGIINISQFSTDFIVEHNKTVATCRNIPIGMQSLINDGPAGRENLINELVQSIDIYKNEDINKLPIKYVLTTDNEISRELAPVLRGKFGVNVECVSYEKNILEDPESQSIKKYGKEDSFVSLVAAANLGSEDLQVDLMPEEIKNQRAIEEKGRQVIWTGVFAMAILVLVCALFFMKIYFRNVYLQELKNEYHIKQYLVVQLDKIAHRVRIIKDYLLMRMVSLDVLDELYRLIPDQMYLQNVVINEQGVVNIQGVSESMSTVFAVVKALEDSELFKNVKTRSTTAKKDRGKDAAAFDIVFKLEVAPDSPIEEEMDDVEE